MEATKWNILLCCSAMRTQYENNRPGRGNATLHTTCYTVSSKTQHRVSNAQKQWRWRLTPYKLEWHFLCQVLYYMLYYTDPYYIIIFFTKLGNTSLEADIWRQRPKTSESGVLLIRFWFKPQSSKQNTILIYCTLFFHIIKIAAGKQSYNAKQHDFYAIKNKNVVSEVNIGKEIQQISGTSEAFLSRYVFQPKPLNVLHSHNYSKSSLISNRQTV